MHVSTCYVGGLRKGVVPEARLGHRIDWRAEYAAAKSARERVELASRQPAQLRAFMDRARAEHGKEGPQSVARASEEARVAWVTEALVDAGRTRAESLGWTDVYTLTKAFAERAAEELWADAGGSLSVVRPAIIESAVAHPFPGWIDGFKVADPLILAYGRGLLPEFPGLPDSVLDLIPVDYVVNAILAAAANPPKGEPEYFHIASGASNPLPFHRMFENVNAYFTANPMPTPVTATCACRRGGSPVAARSNARCGVAAPSSTVANAGSRACRRRPARGRSSPSSAPRRATSRRSRTSPSCTARTCRPRSSSTTPTRVPCMPRCRRRPAAIAGST
ncbi:hypothetical protein GCM10025869_09720 [Homoserinibacter gongjuensis]|uniref:Thioester reductase (TE) domain-containing protein n=1 Tax=Homoserinibacter gongjuensis TaxID=1162968 RepID=A0ABQ6JQT7_9MICO|nr:hypothetical protein GCM10025869_09720 [Homoserinibacter gongjuensis]